MEQKNLFLRAEGNNYYERNKNITDKNFKPHFSYLIYEKYMKKDMKILEIGCADGMNLNYFSNVTGCSAYGIDPSDEAINNGKINYKNINLSVGTADNLEFADGFFDFIYFGFCLYLADRELLSKIVYESDRVLKNGGFLGIADFDTDIPKKRMYKYVKNTYSYKYDYSKMFLGFPQYSVTEKVTFDIENLDKSDSRKSSVVLYKNHENSYYYEEDK